MIPNVAIAARPTSPRSVFEPVSRKTALAHEARRVARRRSVAEGVARRGRTNDRNLPELASAQISERAHKRASRLGVVFHRAIESLWSAGEFDEALAIFREHKADLTRRASGLPRPN